MITLYHSSTSVCSAKVRLVLAEKSLSYESRLLDILAGEQLNPEYLKLNAKGQVPTLIHDGQVITESTVINEYLDEAFPTIPLAPQTPIDRAEMRQWSKIVDESLHEAASVITYVINHRHALLELEPEELEKLLTKSTPENNRRKRSWVYEGIESPDLENALIAYDNALNRMNQQLAQQDWLTGQSFTLADISLLPYVNRLYMLSFEDWWKEKYPRVDDWFDRACSRESFQRAVMDNIPSELAKQMRDRGAKEWPTVRQKLQEYAS